LRSGTEIVYRVPRDHERFTAVAGIDPDHLAMGNVILSISTGDRVLFEKEIAGMAPPVPIELDVSGLKSLTIRAQFGQGGDSGDLVNLCNAKFIK
jgi:hypothetical protein